METVRKPELLAPAGSPEALSAALAAGANAVYFGLKKLNARRGAANILPENLAATVKEVHDAGARAYLTLNIQITQRELGLAFRTLACAEEAGVDGILITDCALLAAKEFFPRLQFHFSTQAGVSSSSGVRAAQHLGLSRVVVARELSKAEIEACTAVGIEIETFVQGAHCFSCSGRCLLSSWGGGRSGNRGACTSPCRVRWTNQQGEKANPLSMHDMSLLRDLDELAAAGVASLKIEGRLKSAKWVTEAVSLYRGALDKTMSVEELAERSQRLGDYSGRRLSDGFYRGCTAGLTGESARPASGMMGPLSHNHEDEEPEERPHVAMGISADEKGGVLWNLSFGDFKDELRIPPQRIANARRAVSVSDIVEAVLEAVPRGEEPPVIAWSDESLKESLEPKNIRNRVVDFVVAFYRNKGKEADGVVRNLDLPEGVRKLLEEEQGKCPENRLHLGGKVSHVRLKVSQLDALAAKLHDPLIVCVNPVGEEEIPKLMRKLEQFRRQIWGIALPEVIYEEQLPAYRSLLQVLKGWQVVIEVNSWDTWELVRKEGFQMMSGQGLAAMNGVAARELNRLGCKVVSASMELDQHQLEDLANACTVPLALTVYVHPKLMITRAELPENFTPEDHAQFEDSRHTVLQGDRDGLVTNLRPQQPMDWRSITNPTVKAAMLIMDLTGTNSLPKPSENASDFNYSRRLR